MHHRYGARLHELLESHAESKDQTSRALGKNHDISQMQKQLHRTVENAAEQTEQMDKMLSNLGQDEQNLQQKIDKKKTELDRHQKRLQSLQTVRHRQTNPRLALPHPASSPFPAVSRRLLPSPNPNPGAARVHG